MNTTYIFGAGASHSYNQSPTGVRPPLANGFFQAYNELDISEDFEVRVGDIVNYVRDVFTISPENFGNFDQDIEQFMTQLDLQLRYLARKMAEGDERGQVLGNFFQSTKAYDQMIFLIAHVLNEIQNGPVSIDYQNIIEICDESDTLITFNWETLIDRALRESGRWSPDIGYQVLFESILDGTWREPKASETDLNLLKLHGSTNWLVPYMTRHLSTGDRGMVTKTVEPGYRAIRWDPNLERTGETFTMSPTVSMGDWGLVPPPDPTHPDAIPVCVVSPSQYYPANRDRYRPGYADFSYFFPPDHPRTGVPLMPLVIAPTSFKLYDEFSHVIDPLWKYAQDALSNAEKVTIIGYSFPETDLRTLNLFRNAFSLNTPREVEVVNPFPEPVCKRLINDVGLPGGVITPLAETFSDYCQRI